MIVKAKNLKEGMIIRVANSYYGDTVDEVHFTKDSEVKVVCNDDTATLFFEMNENIEVV